MDEPRLYIATRDPRGLGGVATMANFVYRTAEDAGYDPCLVCNSLDSEIDVRISDVFKLDVRRQIEHIKVDGMELKGIPRFLPEFEFLQYVLNRRFWQRALADGDAYFGVCGANHCCLPFSRAGVQFGSWTATLFWDDRTDRLESASFPRQMRDRLSRPVMETLEGRIYRDADPIFVLSEYTADRVASRHGVDRDRMEVVPYPIDTELFTPAGPENPETTDPTILFVGRFNDPRKNVTLLLEAVAQLRSSIPDVRLVLVGDEPNDRVAERIEQLDLSDSVTCIDYVENESLPDYYRSADVFAIPSQQEGLAIVGLEAMACGTPVVSTRCGGPEDYVLDGETGYLTPLDEVQPFAQRITELLDTPGKRDEISARARTVVGDKYATDEIAETFREVFERSS